MLVKQNLTPWIFKNNRAVFSSGKMGCGSKYCRSNHYFFKIARNSKDYRQSNSKFFEISVFKISNERFWLRFCLLLIEEKAAKEM